MPRSVSPMPDEAPRGESGGSSGRESGSPSGSEFRRILVRAPNWVGDFVMATPAFRALRERFPAARIALHARPELLPLAAGSAWFDALLPLRSRHRGALPLLREGWSLREAGYELGICLTDSISSALLMRAAGVRHIVGYRRGLRTPLLHQVVEPDPSWGRRRIVPRERFVLGLTQAVGCSSNDTRLSLATTKEEEKAADALLAAAGIDPRAGFVVLAPGASYGPSKQWPTGSFAAVGDGLASRGWKVAIIGSPSEAALCASVAGAMSSPAVDLGGAIDLGVIKALLRRASLLVCNDAGARHIAVAFGVPALVLLGPTSIEKTSLNLEHCTVLTNEVPCRPCYLRECPIDHPCMRGIAVDAVLEAAEVALAERSSG